MVKRVVLNLNIDHIRIYLTERKMKKSMLIKLNMKYGKIKR